jgi:glycogen debranching enzyme
MLLTKLRSDGWAPEKVSIDGHAIYRCHGNGDVVDSGPFFVKLVSAFADATGDSELVRTNLDEFWRMLEVLPHEKETGMVWIDPQNPHTGYGFTDTIAKTGRELFCSLLVFEALTYGDPSMHAV